MGLLSWLGFGGGSASAAAQAPSAARPAYRGADRTALNNYQPSTGSADADLLGVRDFLAAASRDQANNHPFVAGGVDRAGDAVIGAGLRLQARPDAAALGISQDAADDLARAIERVWRGYADDPQRRCDAERGLSAGGLMALAYRHRLIDGEALAVLQYRPRSGGVGTCLQIIDPDRLSTPQNRFDDERLRAGVELDDFGAPIAYHIRRGHAEDWGAQMTGAAWAWDRLPAETPWGRPVVIHHYRRERAGQRRGKLALNSVIGSLVNLTRMSELELRVAVRDALLSGAVTSPYDPDDIEGRVRTPNPETLSAYQAGRLDFHRASNLKIGDDVDLAHLYPGESLNLLAPSRSASNFAVFTEVFLRQVASALGLSYEQLANDWSKVNYSSARAALVEVWRSLDARREEFVAGFVTPWYAAVIEEALIEGLIEPPQGCASYWQAPAAWLRADWLGPARGAIDPLKTAQAGAVRLATGQATHADLAAEDGQDWEERMRQRAREARMAQELGLPPPWADGGSTPPPAAPASNDEEQDLDERIAA